MSNKNQEPFTICQHLGSPSGFYGGFVLLISVGFFVVFCCVFVLWIVHDAARVPELSILDYPSSFSKQLYSII